MEVKAKMVEPLSFIHPVDHLLMPNIQSKPKYASIVILHSFDPSSYQTSLQSLEDAIAGKGQSSEKHLLFG